MEGEDGTDDTQVRVRFVTKIDQYRVVDTPFAVPARLTRYGLSEVINHLLSQGARAAPLEHVRNAGARHSSPRSRRLRWPDPPVPFDFMIGGVLLRTSLQRFMEEQGLSGVRRRGAHACTVGSDRGGRWVCSCPLAARCRRRRRRWSTSP